MRFLRRLWSRTFLFSAAGVLLALMAIGSQYDITLRIRGHWSFSLECSEFVVRWAADPSAQWRNQQDWLEPTVTRSYSPVSSLRWRPIHSAVNPWPKPSPFHVFVFPLWHLTFATLLTAVYLHGKARGKALASIGHCKKCGYALIGLPGSADGPLCPECGKHDQPAS
ncbi:MAG: hypothetical protein ACREJO_08170 [Phycisphaerales bacterium]